MVLRIDFVPTSEIAALAVAMATDAAKANEPTDVLVGQSFLVVDGPNNAMLCWENTVVTHGHTVDPDELPSYWPEQ
jgi:hypothetical protein